MSDVRLLYVTAKDVDQARKIAHELLDRKLIGCANILPQMESIYRWQDKVQQETEVVLILKTISKNAEKTIKAVEELHSYETPCVLSLKVKDGSKGYLNWIKSECSEQKHE